MAAGDRYCGRCGKVVTSMTPCCIIYEGVWDTQTAYKDDRIKELELQVSAMRPVVDAALALGDLMHMVDDYDDPKDQWAKLDRALRDYRKA